jgi:3D (Asp-Asp-Asp) domain-containing protein
VLELYSLDAKLERTRARLDALTRETQAVEAERAHIRAQVAIARRTLAVSERRLAARLRTLYEQGDADPVAILLGATSLDAALTRLDDLRRAASLDRSTVEQARAAKHSLLTLSGRLAARASELRELRETAGSAEAALLSAQSARAAYIGRLAAERRLNEAQISSLKAEAAAVQAMAERVAAPPVVPTTSIAVAPQPADPPTTAAGTITVLATGYSLTGTTATGAPVGYGVVAVDPSVIPLGTRMTIPGYGEGVAVDTGPGVQGAAIDLWFSTPAGAMAWGRRDVTITLH